ncbi:hypothetical protein [uncultured Amaricoccus sp.]|uniref:hypothetical protein n=2 Tax=Pseudomonadota TaxID=1224 RepID=UPI00260670D1|nr:hypothetical protein [uncultured Amaricoccus sp.]
MTVRRFSIPITVDADGDAEVYTPKIFGHLVSVRYVKTDFADGVDFVVTNETTGETVWSEEAVNASASRYPRAATHTTAGAASLYASGGTAVQGRIAIGGDRLKIVVADGGVSKSGTLHFLIEG